MLKQGTSRDPFKISKFVSTWNPTKKTMIQATLRGSSGGSLEGPECLVVFRLVFWSFFSTDFSGSWKKVGLVAYNHPTGSIYHLYTTYKIILYTTYTNWQYIPPIILWCFFGVKIYIQYHYPLKKVHLRGPWKEEFLIVALLLSKGLKIHPGKLIFWTQKYESLENDVPFQVGDF